MRQKVAIMQAMLWEPDLILLDEPLSGLDASSQNELIQILSALKKAGATLVFSSHEEFLVKRLADKILYFVDGKIVSEVENNPNPEGLRAKSVVVVVAKNLESAYESELREMYGVLSVTEAEGESTIVADDGSTTEILRSLLDNGACVISLNRTEGIL
jgi:ABC-type multidrug transport system ATPase subunit